MAVINLVRTRFADHFTPKTRISGEKLFTNGLINVLEHDGAEVDATVGRRYRPSIRYDSLGDTHYLNCSCKEVGPGAGCSHLWALILWLDHKQPNARLYPFSLTYNAWHRSNVDVNEGDWGEEDEEWDYQFVGADEAQEAADSEWEDEIEEPPEPRLPIAERTQSTVWQEILRRQTQRAVASQAWVSAIELIYTISYAMNYQNMFAVNVEQRQRRPDGTVAPIKRLPRRYMDDLNDISGQDQAILMMLMGINDDDGYYYSRGSNSFELTPPLFFAILPRLLASERCRYLTKKDVNPLDLKSDLEKAPWRLTLRLGDGDENGDRQLEILLAREAQLRSIREALLFLGDEYVVFEDGLVSKCDHQGGVDWISSVYEMGTTIIRRDQQEAFLQEYFACSAVPLELPPDIPLEETQGEPVPLLRLLGPKGVEGLRTVPKKYQASELYFVYYEREFRAANGPMALYESQAGKLVHRNHSRELEWRRDLADSGITWRHHDADDLHEVYFIPVNDLLQAVSALIDKGWRVEGETGRFRSARSFSMQVSSGIDWFELRGQVDFEGQCVDMSQMLHALKKKDRFIRLGDGSVGLLPEEWWKRVGIWAQLGEAEKDHLRFERSQTLLLDILLSEQDAGQTSIDETFKALREELRSFVHVTPCDPDDTFHGLLRPYQRHGLGWLLFLQRFRLGGCLADDMGLGKTVQVLALLAQRQRRVVDRPTLVVVPRSLIFNWRDEATRFTPHLKVVDASHGQRGNWTELDPSADLVLITYGTLVRDITQLKDVSFDYVILDEAQAIKNHQTARAKAVRLLKSSYRLALSGTPIENRIEELWSLFEFLNPGFLGRNSTFKALFSADMGDDTQRDALKKAITPFILRRSKGQVAVDLPPKTEEILLCEMEPRQQAFYRTLRDHYRQSLLKNVQTVGMKRVQTQVLEALLRLRQAACHPRLVDPHTHDDSVKIDSLIEQLDEIVREGHKALIFSQFTSFLALLKPRLEQRGWVYEYLDGKTRNRQEKVERFQNDPLCPLFLISLKAGGLGLNLVAADYVFLLDPWWNPAVEAQAIDRTHRLGQERPVFAYRMICRDTVEEKILQLQQSKKSLADSIISESSSMLKEMSAEDLAFLLE